MNRKYMTLISRITEELGELGQIVKRAQKAWDSMQKTNKDW